jgi:hypothetical protein
VVESAGPQDGIEGNRLEGRRDLQDAIRRECFHRRHDGLEGFFPGREHGTDIE